MRTISAWIMLCAAPLAAHDFWIEPATFVPQMGQILSVRFRVGQDLMGDPVARDAELVNQLVFEDASGRKPLVGRHGSDPAGYLRVDSQGLMVIGYFSNPSLLELTAEKFNQYLKEEGLDAVAEMRARRKQTGAGARELFSRCAKSLALSGTANASQADRRLGFPLELVAERNPYAMRVGETLPVRLTYQDRPLAGALVVAMNRANPAEKLSVRTDAAGRVRLPLRQAGMWMIKAVHLVPAPAGAKADWASYWASLTFEMPGALMSRN